MSEAPSLPTARLDAALVLAQLDARAVGKDGKNDFHKYRFTSAESMIQEGRSALNAAKLALVQGATKMRILGERLEQGKEFCRVVVDIEYVLSHESGEERRWWREWPCVESPGRPIDKAMGAALTSALKFQIRDVLQLPRDDEQADMDRRSVRDDEPEPKREEKPRERDPKPANDASEESAPAGKGTQHAFFELLPLIQSRTLTPAALAGQIDRADLTDHERKAADFVVQAYAAKDEKSFMQIASAVRLAGFNERLTKWVLDSSRPAWNALQAPPATSSKGAA